MLTSQLLEADGGDLLLKPVAYPATVKLHILYDVQPQTAPTSVALQQEYVDEHTVLAAVDTALTSVDATTFTGDVVIDRPGRFACWGVIDGRNFYTQVLFEPADPPPPEETGGGETTS